MDNSQADALVNRISLYKWEGVGGCSGKILFRNTDAGRKVNKRYFTFYVYYELTPSTRMVQAVTTVLDHVLSFVGLSYKVGPMFPYGSSNFLTPRDGLLYKL